MNFSKVYFRYDEQQRADSILSWTENMFGPPGQRWRFETMDIIEGPNLWYITFIFQDPRDQIIFNLAQIKSNEIQYN